MLMKSIIANQVSKMKINLHGIEFIYILVRSHDIQVISCYLSFTSVMGGNLDIMFIPGYNYNIYIYTYIYIYIYIYICICIILIFKLFYFSCILIIASNHTSDKERNKKQENNNNNQNNDKCMPGPNQCHKHT